MPKRILLLAALYVIASAGLAGLMLAPFDDVLIADDYYYVSDLAYALLFFAYLTIATPLGLWGALGKTPLAGRVAVCLLPAILLSVWVALNPFLALVQEFVLDQGTWSEFPAYVEQSGELDSLLWTWVSGVLLFLAPAAIGGAVGWFAKRRGLFVAMPGASSDAAVVTRFSLRQLLLLMLGVSALLAVQPILAEGMILGDPEIPLEALAARDAMVADAIAGDSLPADALLHDAFAADLSSSEMRALTAGLEPAELDALINSGAVVEFDFGLDDDVAYDEPSTAESIVQTASMAIALGTPFIIASVICIWTMLFAESPWRRLIWGAPFAILSGGLVLFHDADLLIALIGMTVFFASQAAVLCVARSTGYRLMWTPGPAAEAHMEEDRLSVLEPALA